MLKRSTYFAVFLLLLIFVTSLYLIVDPLSNNEQVDKILTQKVKCPKKHEMSPTKQMRSGVSKDLWIHDKNMGRLHHHIESPRSILIAYPNENRIQLIEQMIGMKC